MEERKLSLLQEVWKGLSTPKRERNHGGTHGFCLECRSPQADCLKKGKG